MCIKIISRTSNLRNNFNLAVVACPLGVPPYETRQALRSFSEERAGSKFLHFDFWYLIFYSASVAKVNLGSLGTLGNPDPHHRPTRKNRANFWTFLRIFPFFWPISCKISAFLALFCNFLQFLRTFRAHLSHLSTNLRIWLIFLLTKPLHEKTITRWQNNRQPWKWQYAFSNTSRDFRLQLRKAEIEVESGNTLSIHTLRKSCILNWANGLPMIVTKELAGHSNIVTTQKYYCQVNPYHKSKGSRSDRGIAK